jgi:hypothetical protein
VLHRTAAVDTASRANTTEAEWFVLWGTLGYSMSAIMRHSVVPHLPSNVNFCGPPVPACKLTVSISAAAMPPPAPLACAVHATVVSDVHEVVLHSAAVGDMLVGVRLAPP